MLHAAIEIIINDGYAALGMRSLARASGLKLGALQYHFPNWESLLEALVTYIEKDYRAAWDKIESAGTELKLSDFIRFLLVDAPGDALQSDRLWPQLWAMAQVEPLLKKSVGDIYTSYLNTTEATLKAIGSDQPRIKALALMSIIEGSTIFVGEGRAWSKHAKAFEALILKYVDDIT